MDFVGYFNLGFSLKKPEFYDFFRDSNAIVFVDKDISKISEAVEQLKNIEIPQYPALHEAAFDEVYKFIADQK